MTAPSWQFCLDAGLTAKEAAEARGMHISSAYGWAKRHGAHWPGSEVLQQRRGLSQATSPLDRALNAAFAEVYGDRWEGPVG